VNGIILLGGFSPDQRSTAIKLFKARGASIIIAHGKKSLKDKPFTHLTASLRLASRLSKKGLVVVTASWLDVLVEKIGVACLDDVNEDTFKDITKELHEWTVVSRILDRVGLRYGALHCCPERIAGLAEAAFSGFSSHPNTFLVAGQRWAEMALLSLSFTRCVYPDQDRVLDSMNLNGNIADADYLLVGDKINPRFKHFNHWPFHDDAASAFFITSLLHLLDVPETRLAWSNARDHDAEVLVQFTKHRKINIIALGKEAEKGLTAMGIVPTASIPHPSWARRFNKRNEYLDSLATIFKSDHSRGLSCTSECRAVLT
jgi:hypothetical protein